MKLIIEIKKIDVPDVDIYISNSYPESGVYELPTDTMNYYIVSKDNNMVSLAFKSVFGFDVAPEEEVVATDISRITIDEALRLIAISKDAKYINTVLKDEN